MILTLLNKNESRDGTVKALWKLSDGNSVESVLIPRALKQRKGLPLWMNGGSESLNSGRFSLCLSTQVGCAMGCDFCLTGKQGFTRDLTKDEIVAQVLEAKKTHPVTNLVFMGMGEPLRNTDALIGSIQDFFRMGFSRRRITVSTSGIVPEIERLSETSVKLALSLHATTDELRSQLMPINRRYPIASVIRAAQEYAVNSKQTVMLEYILLQGINDSLDDANRLFDLAKDWDCKVNLIPFNSFGDGPYQASEPYIVKAFQHALVSRGVTATVRYSGGEDILAACGQLKSLDAVRKRGFAIVNPQKTSHREEPCA